MTVMSKSNEPSFQSQHILQPNSRPQLLPNDQTSTRNGGFVIPHTLKETRSNTRNDSNNAIYSPRWKVDPAAIPRVPLYYPLEPTTFAVVMPLDELTHRITECLRLQSISWQHSMESQVVFQMDGSTPSSRLQFSILIWKQQNTTDDNAYLVEIQRRQGCSMEMRHIRALLTKAITSQEQPPPNVASAIPSHNKVPDTVQLLAMMNDDSHWEDYTNEAMDISLHLLESPNMDQKILGVESLSMLTNPSITSLRDASLVSRAILSSGDAVGERLRAQLTGCFGGRHNQTSQDRFMETMHHLALLVVTNALEVEDQQGGNNHHLQLDSTSTFWKVVLQDLIDNLEAARQYPNQAALSAKCFRLLRKQQTCAAPVLIPLVSLQTCLAEAYEFGKERHLSLETESHQLMMMEA